MRGHWGRIVTSVLLTLVVVAVAYRVAAIKRVVFGE